MSELESLEARLAEQLHAHELPEAVPGLPGASERLGKRLRRRRRVGTIAGLIAAAVVVPGTVWLISSPADRSVPDPAATASTAPSTSGSPRRAAVVDVDLAKLPRGDRPHVDVVVDGTWRRTDGGTTALGIDPETQAAHYLRLGNSLVVEAYRLSGGPALPVMLMDQLGVSQRLEHVSTPVVSGPDRSVVWLDARSSGVELVRLDADGRRQRFPLPAGTVSDASLVSAARSIFLVDDGAVTRFTWTASGLVDPLVVTGATGVRVGSPSADEVVLENDDGCTAVVPAAEPTPRTWNCSYPVTSISPNGRYRFGYSNAKDAGALLDAEDNVLLRLRHAGDIDEVVDDDGNLTFIGHTPLPGDVSNGAAVATCDLAGHCHRSSESKTVLFNSGEKPIALVHP